MQHAVAALSGETTYKSLADLIPELDDVEVMLQACGNLLEEEKGIIRPVHFSVQEFLTNDIPTLPQHHLFRALSSTTSMNAKLGEACMLYLQLAVSPPRPCTIWRKLWDRMKTAPFCQYAAQSFDIHIATSAETVPRTLGTTNSFLSNGSSFLGGVLQLRITGAQFWRNPTSTFQSVDFHVSATTIIFASDLYNVKRLQTRSVGKNSPRYAIHYASSAGITTAVKRLLEQDCEVNERDINNATPLYFASTSGHNDVVKLLINSGADANGQGGYYGNALQAASEGGHDKTVQMLLDKGADVNAQGGQYGNALYAGSEGGHDKTVQMLLDKGADVNAQGGQYGNALQAASAGGYDKTVQILLDRGADVNAQGGQYGNALQAASLGGHDKTVQILLDKGVDVNAQGGHYGNALQAASARGHDKTVQMLLDKGADIAIQGGIYGSAQNAAARNGSVKVLRVLLGGSMLQPLVKDKQGRSCLHIAARFGHLDAFNLLIDRGYNVNSEDLKGESSLHYAASGSSSEVAQRVLQLTDINTTLSQSGQRSIRLSIN